MEIDPMQINCVTTYLYIIYMVRQSRYICNNNRKCVNVLDHSTLLLLSQWPTTHPFETTTPRIWKSLSAWNSSFNGFKLPFPTLICSCSFGARVRRLLRILQPSHTYAFVFGGIYKHIYLLNLTECKYYYVLEMYMRKHGWSEVNMRIRLCWLPMSCMLWNAPAQTLQTILFTRFALVNIP